MFKWFLKLHSKKKNVELQYLNRKTPLWKPLIFLLPALGLIIIFTILPFITTLNASLHPLADKHKANSGSFGFSGFTDVINDFYFKSALTNSLLYAFLVIPISILISLSISSAISSVLRKWLQGAFQTIFFLPYVTSGVAISLAFAYLFDSQTGLINQAFGISTPWLTNGDSSSFSAFFVILIQGIWSSLAFQILIFTTAMLGVDKTRYKAASIDGAGPIKQFFYITLPSIKKTMSFIITIGLIGAIKVFPLALFQNNQENAKSFGGMTLMMYVFSAVSNGKNELAAAASIILVIIAIMFSAIVKNSINGIGWLFNKGGEWIVQKNIKNSLQLR